MAPPTPCLDLAVRPNWMTEPGGHWSEKLPRGQRQLWRTYKSLCLRLVGVCMWQESHKLYTKLVVWQGGKKEARKYYTQSCLCYAKTHLEDSVAIWKTVLWSDETKIELFGLNSQVLCLAKTKHSTPPKTQHTYCEAWWCNIMLWGCCLAEDGQVIHLPTRQWF